MALDKSSSLELSLKIWVGLYIIYKFSQNKPITPTEAICLGMSVHLTRLSVDRGIPLITKTAEKAFHFLWKAACRPSHVGPRLGNGNE